MSVFGSGGSRTGPLDARRVAPAVEQDPRRGRSRALGRGTLACPRCDVPLALPGRVAAGQAIACPFCAHRGTVGSFVSLAVPTRPTRVVVTVSAPT